MTLLEDFAAAQIDTGETTIFVRHGGHGPAILLLHGIPQTHLMWRGVGRCLHATLLSSVQIFADMAIAAARYRPRITSPIQSCHSFENK